MIRKPLAFILLILLLTSLACNLPFTQARPTVPPPPTVGIRVGTAVPTANNELAPTATLPGDNNGSISLPTFTPRPITNSNNPLPAATVNAATATPSPAVSGGPLTFTYTISWRLDGDSGNAIATVTFHPAGGDGNYSYFRDELPVTGPIFEYRWAKCTGNPGSLRVTSGDGQTIKIDYYESVPCN